MSEKPQILPQELVDAAHDSVNSYMDDLKNSGPIYIREFDHTFESIDAYFNAKLAWLDVAYDKEYFRRKLDDLMQQNDLNVQMLQEQFTNRMALYLMEGAFVRPSDEPSDREKIDWYNSEKGKKQLLDELNKRFIFRNDKGEIGVWPRQNQNG